MTLAIGWLHEAGDQPHLTRGWLHDLAIGVAP